MATLIAYLIASLLAILAVKEAVERVETKRGPWAAHPRDAFAVAFFLATLPWALAWLAWDWLDARTYRK